MVVLDQLFAGLLHHHVATTAAPLPEAAPGITWVYAANGLFKRGCSPELDILIPVADYAPLGPALDLSPPGLARLLPRVRWPAWRGRIGGALLAPLLANARQASSGNGMLHVPIERQYFIVAKENGNLGLIVPREQHGTSTHLAYTMPAEPRVLVDIHSHHGMAPFFSATDDRDDLGLSVSVVIGHLFTDPTIRCRLNVYGHRHEVPASLIFDDLGPFTDAYRTPKEVPIAAARP